MTAASHIAEELEPGARTAFSRHDGIYRPMWLNARPNPGAEADCLPPVGPEAQVEERAGRNTLLLIVRMSSGRLSLDRVVATIARFRFTGTGRLTRTLRCRMQKGTFLLCTEGDISTLR